MTALVLHETLNEAGARETVLVSSDDGVLVVTVAGKEARLPMDVLVRVMERYGKPLDPGVALDGPGSSRVDLGVTGALHRIRHRGFYDVIARDFVVFSPRDGEPLAELATAVSAALAHFAEAAGRDGA